MSSMARREPVGLIAVTTQWPPWQNGSHQGHPGSLVVGVGVGVGVGDALLLVEVGVGLAEVLPPGRLAAAFPKMPFR
jgi:hypothetical protein